jgi:hypothetical protein
MRNEHVETTSHLGKGGEQHSRFSGGLDERQAYGITEAAGKSTFVNTDHNGMEGIISISKENVLASAPGVW